MSAPSKEPYTEDFATELTDNSDFAGVHFVLKSASPPLTSHHVFSNSIVSWQQPFPAPAFYLKWLSYGSPLYITSVRTSSGSKISISRQELSRAWVIGLNALRFHADLLEVVEDLAEGGANEERTKQAEIILHHGREWYGCYLELDWALSKLHQLETSGQPPQSWLIAENYDLHDLISTSQSGIDDRSSRSRKAISDLFIYAASHLLQLHEQGYSRQLIELGDSVGFEPDELQYCYVPNLGLPHKQNRNEFHNEFPHWNFD
ncbi:uncharacterized protein I206_105034 [Kwoniella pini CBS 10737]|uniref:Uncharacterized protein n=1 Tax=Kwoniella pini CBS 10737 TaxID=1296096 RepID=A0A1B9I8F7_9TREE|nr:uncharacterized protein I206_02574 [Kwoniella pini CBS 10737]OCF51858.1 hypothetical protein I206_02574 [Kwoniella pini CBS 10737]